MNYTQLNKAPLIYFSNNLNTIHRIVKKGGEIENKAALYGYCVGIGYGKKGLQWIIANKHLNQLEIYWTKLDFESPENVEIIARTIADRSNRDFDAIFGRAYLIMTQLGKKELQNPFIAGLAEHGNININLELFAKSADLKIKKINQ